MGDDSQKNIEEVKVGDKVVSQSEDGKKSVSTVTKLDQPVRDHMCKIKFTNEESLKLTDEHPLFTQDGWKAINPKNTFKEVPDLPVTELKKGDKVVKSDGTKAEVESFACWSEKIQTYNLILDGGVNTYFADGFLAHNKEGWPACPAGQILVCPEQTPACLSMGACRASFPSAPVSGPVVCAGKEELGNLRYECLICSCVTPCSVTAPDINSVSFVSASGLNYNARINWTKGTGGLSQEVYSDTIKNRVVNNCDNECDVKVTGLGTGVQNYNTINYPTPYPLLPNRVEYWKIRNFESATCNISSDIYPSLLKCTVSPASLSLIVDDTATLTSGVLSATDVRVKFISGNTAVASLNKVWDNAYPYNVDVTAEGVETTTITTEVYVGGRAAPDCTTTTNVVVTAPDPWWQVKDGDVTTNGNIRSYIFPAGVKFILDGLGGYPGVASYGGLQAVFGNGVVSSKGWLANTTSTWLTSKTYDYNYFRGLLPSDWWEAKIPIASGTINSFPTGSANDEGYIVYYHSGNLIINGAQTLGNNKVLLFVDGDLTINNISLTDGAGFFMAVVKGNIIVAPSAAFLEGFYLADNQFRTGMGSVQLNVRGSVIGTVGVLLQRNLGAGNTTNPAEVFEYAPDLIFTYPAKLSVRKMRWKEVAP